MSKWTYTYPDGETVEFEAEDDEVEAIIALLEAEQAAGDDGDGEQVEDDDDDGSDGEPSREADTPAEFARVEDVYRKERAAIRASSDATDLRLRRQAMERTLNDARQSNIAHTRARDLLGEIEQRELRLRAERLATRGR